MSKAGRMGVYDWWLLSEEFLDYLGALSVEIPDLGTPEARAVLSDAAEAAVGSISYAAYFPYDDFQVFLDYVNFGMSYERGTEGGRETVTTDEWLAALSLAVLAGKAERHGEAFHFARRAPQEGQRGRPGAELINALMAYVYGDTGDDDANYPPTDEEKRAAIDAALARLRTHEEKHDEEQNHDEVQNHDGGLQGGNHDATHAAGQAGSSSPPHPHSIALRALHALTHREPDVFREELTGLLEAHRAASRQSDAPRELLPLIPLALTALAYRHEGWQPPVDSAYLPRALVTGFESAGPRVAGYGRARRPDAVAQLAAGSVTLERPEHPRPLHPESEALFEKYIQEAFPPETVGEPPAAWRMLRAMADLCMLFGARASVTGDATDRQCEDVRLAAELGSALFRTCLAEPGTDVELTIDGTTRTYPANHGAAAGPDHWQRVTSLALITGVREHLAPLVLTDPELLARDESGFASYRQALHDYLRGADPEPATDRALNDCEKAGAQGFLPPPAVLFSQLVDGDEESFNLALLDALEAHRDHHQVADRASETKAAVNLDILALTCHAIRRGWNIRVNSAYLPPRFLAAAERGAFLDT
ncbi:immunity 49 family protein [Streptomyces sp. NA04227]|nr:immunity 49 family protein [Streptomyces sp. NA04227]QKW10560.1 immunity 49 family protein [Streptomyces sp. NA04227]